MKNLTADDTAEWVEFLYGRDSLSVVMSALLRGMITATPGYELFAADYAKIEVVVLWWLARNEPGLKILRAGKDPYIYQAAANLARSYVDIEEGYLVRENWAVDARQLGKAQTLGAGFGMGWEKFRDTALTMYGLKLSDEQAQAAIKSYREANAAVPVVWKAYETAAIAALEIGGAHVAGRCKFFKEGRFLWAELPSGRRLAYCDPQIAWRESDYGARKTLEYSATNPKTKKWDLHRTWGGKIAENVTQAVARDIMMYALPRVVKAGFTPLLTVHDEIIAEAPKGLKNVREFTTLLCETPPWGKGLPIEAEGWKGSRYRK